MSALAATANPYRFGRPIEDPDGFYGREKQLRDIFDRINKRECVNIVGERRIGKTSLLYQMHHDQIWRRYLPTDQDSLCVYVNAEIVPQDPAGFFRDVFREARRVDPDLSIDPDGGDLAERDVRRLLEAIQPRRLVLLIDEFELISQSDAFPTRFFVFLRGLSFCYDISFVIATASRLFECCSHEVVTSPFPNIFKVVELGPFSQEHVDHFVERTSSTSGCPMWKVRDDIVAMAGGFPYLIQIACWNYYQAWQESGDLGPELRENVERRFQEDARSHFEAVWERYLSDEERSVVLGLLRGQDSIRPNVVWRLERKGYVQDGRVVPESFASYIKRETAGQIEIAPTVVPSEGLWVDEEANCVFLEGKRIDPPLTKHQFRLVKLLFENKGKLCTPYMTVSAVWSEDYIDDVDDQRIAQLVSRLRKRIEPDGRPWKYILTVHGRGLTLGDGVAKN